MSSLYDLINPLTPDECLTALGNILDTVGVDTTAWQEGTITRTELEAFASVLSYTTWIAAGSASSGFLELAKDEFLTVHAAQEYGLERELGVAGQGTLEVTNESGATLTRSAGQLIVRNRNTLAEYKNTGPINIVNGATGFVTIEASIAGEASNAAVGEIDALTTAIAGVSVINTTTVIGTSDESDSALKDRCRLSRAAASPFGPSDSYRYYAVTSKRPDGTSIGVSKVRILPVDGFGSMTVVIATDFGAVPSPDLAFVDARLRAEALTQGPTLTVASAAELVVGGVVNVYIYNSSNLTTTDVQQLVGAAITERFRRLPIGGDGGFLYQDSLKSAIEGCHPSIYHCVVSSPSGDVAIASNAVAVVGAFIINVIQTAG